MRLFLCILSVIFTMVGCHHYDAAYLSKKEIQKTSFDEYKARNSGGKNYGAIQLRMNNNPYDEGRMLMLNRKGSQYYAETLVGKNKDTRYFMSAGADSRENMPTLGFRMEF
jgi:hypothetical protein